MSALPLAAARLWTAVQAIQAVFLPSDTGGRYFDGLVVHHDGSQFIPGGVAAIAFVFAASLAWSAYCLAMPDHTSMHHPRHSTTAPQHLTGSRIGLISGAGRLRWREEELFRLLRMRCAAACSGF